MPHEDIVRPYTSLFAGAGGLDCGFAEAGFSCAWANELDASATETHNLNLGHHAVAGDLLQQQLPPVNSSGIVIGGPPCQGFSVAGKMDPDDPRSKHVFNFLDVVEKLGSVAFVMENVKNLGANPKWASIREALAERAAQLGYTTDIFVLNASHYGVPQARERMFFVGIRGAKPRRPEPTTLDRPATVRDALATLPPYGEPGNDTFCTARIVPAKNPILRPDPYGGNLFFNGNGRVLKLDAPSLTLPASMGGNATPIIDQDELAHSTPPWVVEYHRHLRAGGTPLKTAPSRLRRITVEEAAAIQTFPIGWKFAGPPSSQYRQIGNAVPPRLAAHVANALREALADAGLA